MSWFIFRYRNVCKWSVHDDVRCGVYELSGFWWRTWNVGSVFSLPVSTDIWWTNEPVDCTDKGWTWQRFAGQPMFLRNWQCIETRQPSSHQLLWLHKCLPVCYLFTVSNSCVLFSHGRPSQQLLSSCFPPVILTLMYELDLWIGLGIVMLN